MIRKFGVLPVFYSPKNSIKSPPIMTCRPTFEMFKVKSNDRWICQFLSNSDVCPMTFVDRWSRQRNIVAKENLLDEEIRLFVRCFRLFLCLSDSSFGFHLKLTFFLCIERCVEFKKDVNRLQKIDRMFSALYFGFEVSNAFR